jgi:predicted signal transduction protein with EAL and GGDEF domain
MAVAVPTLDAALVDAAGLYRAADTALYTAKRDGSGLAVHVLQGDEVDRTTGRHQGD